MTESTNIEADLRDRVCEVLWATMSLWERQFEATRAVAESFLDGSLTEDMVLAFPIGEHPETLCRAMAHAVGLPFHDEGPQYSEGGWRIDVTADDVDCGFRMLRAIPDASVALEDTDDDGEWRFHGEHLDEHDVTIDEIREVMLDLPLYEAAQLIVDAATDR